MYINCIVWSWDLINSLFEFVVQIFNQWAKQLQFWCCCLTTILFKQCYEMETTESDKRTHYIIINPEYY